MGRFKIPRLETFLRIATLTLIFCTPLSSFSEEVVEKSFTENFKDYARKFASDIPAMWRCFKMRWMAYFRPHPPIPFHINGKTPIILVHGYMHDNSVWEDLRLTLKNAAVGPVFSPSLSRSIDDIRKSAREVAIWVQIAKKTTGCDSVILVGHSMGGLASAYAVQHYLDEEDVIGVITLGTPHHGTSLANIAIGKAAFQMRTESAFVSGLRNNIQLNPKTEYICLGSLADEAVLPASSCFLYKEGEGVGITYDHVGHNAMLFDERVAEDVVSMIQTLNDRRGSNESQVQVWIKQTPH